jgi:hypothetical protein
MFGRCITQRSYQPPHGHNSCPPLSDSEGSSSSDESHCRCAHGSKRLKSGATSSTSVRSLASGRSSGGPSTSSDRASNCTRRGGARTQAQMQDIRRARATGRAAPSSRRLGTCAHPRVNGADLPVAGPLADGNSLHQESTWLIRSQQYLDRVVRPRPLCGAVNARST